MNIEKEKTNLNKKKIKIKINPKPKNEIIIPVKPETTVPDLVQDNIGILNEMLSLLEAIIYWSKI